MSQSATWLSPLRSAIESDTLVRPARRRSLAMALRYLSLCWSSPQGTHIAYQRRVNCAWRSALAPGRSTVRHFFGSKEDLIPDGPDH
jgi:hypothetical protein